jgi:hypothetical protein
VNHFFFSLLLLLATKAVLGATVTGKVSDENGQAIAGSTLCLSLANVTPLSTDDCLQTQTSDTSGNYTLNPTAAGAYLVTVIDDRFPTFTWLPVARTVNIAQPSDQVNSFNFKRQFSFSNFQKPVAIVGSDLPELAGFNLAQDTVFVKVYAVDPARPTQQTVFFIGRVTSEADLKFATTAPWTVRQVIYEIFSATAARQGSLILGS